MNKQYIFAALLLTTLPMIAISGEVTGSKHDLSVSNPRYSMGGASDHVCIFCHTPHAASLELKNAGGSNAPIWNRKISDMNAFILYGGTVGTPSSISLACLSCHDGVTAANGRPTVFDGASAVNPVDMHYILNQEGSGTNSGSTTPNCYACHPNGGQYPDTTWQIGPNLTDDHPISINYAASTAHTPGEFHLVPTNDLRLFNGLVECATCHSVHNNDNGRFLKVSNNGSALCKSCHIK